MDVYTEVFRTCPNFLKYLKAKGWNKLYPKYFKALEQRIGGREHP